MHYVVIRLNKAAAPEPEPPESEPEPAPEPAAPSQPQAQAQPPAQTRPAAQTSLKPAPAAGQSAAPAKAARPAPQAATAQPAPSPYHVPAERRDGVKTAAALARQQHALPVLDYNRLVAFDHGGDMRDLHPEQPQHPAVWEAMRVAQHGGVPQHPHCRCQITQTAAGETMITLPTACARCKAAAEEFNAQSANRATEEGQEAAPASPEAQDVERAEAEAEPEEMTEELEMSAWSARSRRHILILGGPLPAANLHKATRRRFRLKTPKAPRLPSLPSWPTPKPPKQGGNTVLQVDPAARAQYQQGLVEAGEKAKARLRPTRIIVLHWRR